MWVKIVVLLWTPLIFGGIALGLTPAGAVAVAKIHGLHAKAAVNLFNLKTKAALAKSHYQTHHAPCRNHKVRSTQSSELPDDAFVINFPQDDRSGELSMQPVVVNNNEVFEALPQDDLLRASQNTDILTNQGYLDSHTTSVHEHLSPCLYDAFILGDMPYIPVVHKVKIEEMSLNDPDRQGNSFNPDDSPRSIESQSYTPFIETINLDGDMLIYPEPEDNIPETNINNGKSANPDPFSHSHSHTHVFSHTHTHGLSHSSLHEKLHAKKYGSSFHSGLLINENSNTSPGLFSNIPIQTNLDSNHGFKKINHVNTFISTNTASSSFGQQNNNFAKVQGLYGTPETNLQTDIPGPQGEFINHGFSATKIISNVANANNIETINGPTNGQISINQGLNSGSNAANIGNVFSFTNKHDFEANQFANKQINSNLHNIFDGQAFSNQNGNKQNSFGTNSQSSFIQGSNNVVNQNQNIQINTNLNGFGNNNGFAAQGLNNAQVSEIRGVGNILNQNQNIGQIRHVRKARDVVQNGHEAIIPNNILAVQSSLDAQLPKEESFDHRSAAPHLHSHGFVHSHSHIHENFHDGVSTNGFPVPNLPPVSPNVNVNVVQNQNTVISHQTSASFNPNQHIPFSQHTVPFSNTQQSLVFGQGNTVNQNQHIQGDDFINGQNSFSSGNTNLAVQNLVLGEPMDDGDSFERKDLKEENLDQMELVAKPHLVDIPFNSQFVPYEEYRHSRERSIRSTNFTDNLLLLQKLNNTIPNISKTTIFNVTTNAQKSEEGNTTAEQIDELLQQQYDIINLLKKEDQKDENLRLIGFIGENILKQLENNNMKMNRTKRQISETTNNPLRRLISDPTVKLDIPKTLENIGSATKGVFESSKAPIYHVRNALGNTRNVAMSILKADPTDAFLPTDYEIIKKDLGTVEAVNTKLLEGEVGTSGTRMNFGELNPHEDNISNTFQKIGNVVKNAIESGKNSFVHAGDALDEARRVIYSAKHITTRTYILEKSSPMEKQNEAVLVAPRILDISENMLGEKKQNIPHYIKTGDIFDAVGLSNPNVLQPELEIISLNSNKIKKAADLLKKHRDLRSTAELKDWLKDNARVNPVNQDIIEPDDDILGQTLTILENAKKVVGVKNMKEFFLRMKIELRKIANKMKTIKLKQNILKQKKAVVKPLSRSKFSIPKKDPVILGARLPLTKDLLKPFMGRPTQSDVEKYLIENGDIKATTVRNLISPRMQHVQPHYNTDPRNVLRAINPLMYERYFNETLNIKNRTERDNSKSNFTQNSSVQKTEIDHEDTVEMPLKKETTRTSMKLPDAVTKPFMGSATKKDIDKYLSKFNSDKTDESVEYLPMLYQWEEILQPTANNFELNSVDEYFQ